MPEIPGGWEPQPAGMPLSSASSRVGQSTNRARASEQQHHVVNLVLLLYKWNAIRNRHCLAQIDADGYRRPYKKGDL